MDTPKDQPEAQTPDTATTDTASTPPEQAAPATTQATATTPDQTVTTQPAAEPLPPKVENFMQQPHAQQPLSPDSHHTKKFMTKLLVVLILILLIIALALGYFITMGRTKSVQSVQTNSQAVVPTARPTATPTPDATASWQMFTSTATGFSFKYPADWKVRETKDRGTTVVTATAPSGLVAKTLLGPAGVGGKCDDTPEVAQEPITVFGMPLNLFYKGNTEKQLVDYAYVIKGTTPCPNIAFIDISSLTKASDPTGLNMAQITLSYGSNVSKPLTDFKSQDLDTAKVMLSTFTISAVSPTAILPSTSESPTLSPSPAK